MLSPAHETMVEVIRSNPQWFGALLEALEQGDHPATLAVADSSVRVLNALEVRPDVLFVQGERRGPWRIVELQRAPDPEKQRQWLLTTAALYYQRGEMGDLFVVTHSRATAAWARSIAMAKAKHGTRLALTPAVVLLTRKTAEALLATGAAELAVFAAWAVHTHKGAAAVKVVERAVDTVQRADDETLRVAGIQAILNMLDGALRQAVYKMILDLSKIPEGPVLKYVRKKFEARGRRKGEKIGEARGEARGKRLGEAEALLRVLARRGLVVDDVARARILACDDAATLDTWLDRAVTAATLAEVLGPARK